MDAELTIKQLVQELTRQNGELQANIEAAADFAAAEGVTHRQPRPQPFIDELRGEYPYGSEYNFGIKINEAVVTVYASVVYRGGKSLEIDETEVTILADGDWIALKYDPETDTATVEQWDAADGVPEDKNGYLYRGLHKFGYTAADGDVPAQASWEFSSLWGGELGMMGY